MSKQNRAIGELEARIGYQFKDPSLLQRAVSHSSAVAPTKRNAKLIPAVRVFG